MKLPEPTAWVHKNDFGRLMFSSSPTVPPWSFPVFTEAQLREALASQADELKQLQEQNTYLDKVASELQGTCDRQATKLAIHRVVMQLASDLLKAARVNNRRDGNLLDYEFRNAIEALEEALK